MGWRYHCANYEICIISISTFLPRIRLLTIISTTDFGKEVPCVQPEKEDTGGEHKTYCDCNRNTVPDGLWMLKIRRDSRWWRSKSDNRRVGCHSGLRNFGGEWPNPTLRREWWKKIAGQPPLTYTPACYCGWTKSMPKAIAPDGRTQAARYLTTASS